MRLGIIGLPGSGKTTVFNAVAGAHAAVGVHSQPGDLHRAVVRIPDPRLDALFTLIQSRKIVHAEIEYLDFPPPVKTEAPPESVFPAAVRECEGIVAVINCFDPAVEHGVEERIRHLHTETILADFVTLEGRRSRLEKDLARGSKHDPGEIEVVRKASALLDAGQPLRSAHFTPSELHHLSGFAPVSLKPLLIVMNMAEGEPMDSTRIEQIRSTAGLGVKAAVTAVCGKVEMEVAELNPADRAAFLADFGITEPATNMLVRLSYDLLDLITFFTGAEKESRAWPIKRGTTALEAAGHIHQDMKRGFIRAEVVPVTKLLELRGMAACRKAAAVRLEGKEYVIADGDFIFFRFHV